MSGDFLNAMAQPPVQANLDATKPRVVTLTEESLLADVSKIAKEAPSAAPKEGSMAAMAQNSAPPTPSAMNKAPSVDPFDGM
mmetsp:Transcript_3559/g.11043  ORF Transcript_3559/g.11043 Transcript_3559/m.11043 type:complete len:82 (-) Transcript_3559:134-379(-)